MTPTTPADARAASPMFAALLDLWQARAGSAGGVPARDALTPADLMRFLPALVLAETDGAGAFVVAWAGTGVRERLGGDPARRPLTDLLPGDGVREALAAVRLGDPVGLRAAAGQAGPHGTDAPVRRALLLPLADDRGGVAAVLAALPP